MNVYRSTSRCLLIAVLLTSVGTVGAAPAAKSEATQSPAASDRIDLSQRVDDHQQAIRPNRHSGKASQILAEQVWKSRITSPPKNESHQQQDLARLIAQLRAVDVAGAGLPTTEVASTALAIPNDVNVPAVLPTTTPSVPAATPVADTVENGTLSEQVLAHFVNLPLETLAVDQSLAIGELLYETGHATSAARYYQKVAEQIDPNDPFYGDNRAWALFQWGNCIRHTDPVEAKRLYLLVQTEFPASPWVPLASARHDLANWYWKETPRQHLEQVNPTTPETLPASTQVAKGDSSS